MDIQNYLSVISDYNISGWTDDAFSGILIDENNNIVLKCRTTREQFLKLRDNTANIIGRINKSKVTLISPRVNCSSNTDGSDWFHLTITPSEIIIGESYEDDNIRVTTISSQAKDWNCFNLDPKKNYDLNALKKVFVPDPVTLSCKDNDGVVQLVSFLSSHSTLDKIEFQKRTMVTFRFITPIKIDQAIRKITSLRSLFAFLSDHYISLGKIEFADVNGTSCLFHMNYTESIDIKNTPFLIEASDIENDFSGIWNRWSEFYNENNCIIELFYEIICNRSTRINQFLNLTQALEVYSERYRKESSNEVFNSYKKIEPKIHTQKALFHKLCDIFKFINYFSFSDTEIGLISKKISDGRNYFTHYDKQKRKNCELSLNDMSSFNRYMRYILISIIYKELKISEDKITKSLETYKYRICYDDLIEIINQHNETVSDKKLRETMLILFN